MQKVSVIHRRSLPVPELIPDKKVAATGVQKLKNVRIEDLVKIHILKKRLGTIHKGRPMKFGIFRPPSPVCPGLTIEFLKK